jgi:hypothetical protein
MTIAATVAVLAVIYRVDAAKNLLTGEDKFLGIF